MMAGKARNNPPTLAPQTFPTHPATSEIIAPKTKRTATSRVLTPRNRSSSTPTPEPWSCSVEDASRMLPLIVTGPRFRVRGRRRATATSTPVTRRAPGCEATTASRPRRTGPSPPSQPACQGPRLERPRFPSPPRSRGAQPALWREPEDPGEALRTYDLADESKGDDKGSSSKAADGELSQFGHRRWLSWMSPCGQVALVRRHRGGAT